MTALLRLPLHQLAVGPDHPPGLYLPAVLALVDGTRTDDRPIEVETDCCGRYRITNGRHRYTAALIRGDRDVTCTLTREAGP